ncbi:MAG: hypothetical protein GDA42_04080 [Ekhidna sp.]|nr:hypothetical protein [Ekhidna sp.]
MINKIEMTIKWGQVALFGFLFMLSVWSCDQTQVSSDIAPAEVEEDQKNEFMDHLKIFNGIKREDWSIQLVMGFNENDNFVSIIGNPEKNDCVGSKQERRNNDSLCYSETLENNEFSQCAYEAVKRFGCIVITNSAWRVYECTSAMQRRFDKTKEM